MGRLCGGVGRGGWPRRRWQRQTRKAQPECSGRARLPRQSGNTAPVDPAEWILEGAWTVVWGGMSCPMQASRPRLLQVSLPRAEPALPLSGCLFREDGDEGLEIHGGHQHEARRGLRGCYRRGPEVPLFGLLQAEEHADLA